MLILNANLGYKRESSHSTRRAEARLIHVSDFINEEDGRLVLLDENGKIVCDA